mmetsp:Transcript_9021/g.25923  ORF Transcript_9021/g.25923 Transcript_9021/m.25923 type:complete len:233 (+) Transcript_9021:790-1488(+)
MSEWRSSTSFLLLSLAFWQRSRCAMSSCSSWRRTAIIPSMAAMTLSKWPPDFNMCATSAVFELLYLAANCVSFDTTAVRWSPSKRRAADNCMKVVAERSKISFASSLDKMAMALSMPASSSVRRRVRSLHSVALFAQPSFMSANKASSAESCSLVTSKICWLSDNCLLFVASSRVCCSKVAWSVSASAIFVRIKSSWDFCASASSAFDFSRSPTKVSYMPFKMPWICVDCGA